MSRKRDAALVRAGMEPGKSAIKTDGLPASYDDVVAEYEAAIRERDAAKQLLDEAVAVVRECDAEIVSRMDRREESPVALVMVHHLKRKIDGSEKRLGEHLLTMFAEIKADAKWSTVEAERDAAEAALRAYERATGRLLDEVLKRTSMPAALWALFCHEQNEVRTLLAAADRRART